MITINNLNNFAVEHGVSLATVEVAKTVFTGDTAGLSANTKYSMVNDGGGYSPIVEGTSRRNGVVSKFNAISFESSNGEDLKIGVTSLITPVMVLDDQNYAGETWDGVAAAHAYHRYGSLTKSFGPQSVKDYVNDDGTATKYKGYPVGNFETGNVLVKYIVPRFKENDNHPIFNTECKIRSAYFAKDWKDFPGAGNNTSLPVATETVSAGTTK